MGDTRKTYASKRTLSHYAIEKHYSLEELDDEMEI